MNAQPFQSIDAIIKLITFSDESDIDLLYGIPLFGVRAVAGVLLSVFGGLAIAPALSAAALVRSRRCSGTRVTAPSANTDARALLAEHARVFAATAGNLGISDEDALAAIRHAPASREPG